MGATTICAVHARQILDSRGNPTVEAEVHLAGGGVGRASAPSGASTGKAEAFELRDGGDAWGGRGVGRAVASVTGEIAKKLLGRNAIDQQDLDATIREVDGTPNLSRLGGNAALAVSLAAVRAGAQAQGQALWQRFAELADSEPSLPMPMVNILSGGLHAGRGMDVQDFLAVPLGAGTFSEALEWVCRVRSAAADVCTARGITTLLADEGGLSPGFASADEALDLMVAAIERAGLGPGADVAIAIDVASSSLAIGECSYDFPKANRRLTSQQMIEMQADWVSRYPVVSIEDGLGEDDWASWPEMTIQLQGIQLVGDDLFSTQPDRIERGIANRIGNAALIKVNQNGTVSGALEAIRVARSGGYATVISARSGETEDDFLADLAVGTGGRQVKIGSVRNSERQSKYNQLLRIEEAGLPWAGTAGIAPLA